jgi:hypothetical protein
MTGRSRSSQRNIGDTDGKEDARHAKENQLPVQNSVTARLERKRVIGVPCVTHLRFRVVK